jgi:FAD-dependent urate hydroxylase
MFDTEALIIGAGPFGLALSAHLSALDVDHVIVGKALNMWYNHAPIGMFMKSEPYGSDIAAPDRNHDVGAYARLHGITDYADRKGPLASSRFLDYGDWFIKELVPDVRDTMVTELTPVDGGFRATLADGAPITARQVVIATGQLPYTFIPEPLAGLDPALVSHTSKHRDLSVFKGQKVVVLGAGQSALEAAALLHENGADITLIARESKLHWSGPTPEHLSALGHVRRPVNKLCEGWPCVVWNNPSLFMLQPESRRVRVAKTALGPGGSWWLRHRVEGVLDAITDTRITQAVPDKDGVKLTLDGAKQSSLTVDHVLSGTGFRIDLARLPFLPETLRSTIKTLENHPVVNRVGETNIAGLYFAGAPTVLSVGPSARFIAGTHTISAVQAKAVARRARAGKNG